MALTKPKLSNNIDTDVSIFSDPIVVLKQGSMSADTDVGFLFNRANGLVSNVALIWQESTKSLVHILTNSSGQPNANLAVTGYANVTVGNILTIAGAGIYVNGSLGGPGDVLVSTGSGISWAPPGAFQGGNVTGTTQFSNTVQSTSTTTGAVTVTGGVGVAGNVYANAVYTVTGLRWAANGAAFSGGNRYTANTAPPTSGNIAGDQWYDTVEDILYEYISDGTSSYWVDTVTPVFATTPTTNVAAVVTTTTVETLSPFLLAGM